MVAATTLESGTDLLWSEAPSAARVSRTGRRKTRLRAAFIFFVLLNASLYVRPADILPAVEGLPIYQFLIIACLLMAMKAVGAQLRTRDLRNRPITVCVIGLGLIILVSQAANGLWENIATDG